jgi:uncharacterized membrane protein YfcA
MLGIVGLAAQLVDGALGMAYGVTSSTLLLVMLNNAKVASATVHLAEIGTTLVSGISHWKFGNVDWKVVFRVGIPGAVGAFAGATFLSNLSTEVAAPFMACLLFVLGAYVLGRFTFIDLPPVQRGRPLGLPFLVPLGLIGGFVDSTGGGGWGPIGTPTLLASGRMEPRKVIGSIDTSEFLVTLASSAGFFFAMDMAEIDFTWVLALLAGGLIAAPIAAWLVRHIPSRVLGSAVGGLIVLTNTRTLLRSDWIGASGSIQGIVLGIVALLWVGAILWSVRAHRRLSDNVETGSKPRADKAS